MTNSELDVLIAILTVAAMPFIVLLGIWLGFRKGNHNAWERGLRKRGFGEGWKQEMKKRLREMREWGI